MTPLTEITKAYNAEHSGHEYFTNEFNWDARIHYQDQAVDKFLAEVFGVLGVSVEEAK